MAKTVAFANQKGGVAKSTSCHNIATAKAMQGKRVLMVDMDPQASLSIMCGVEPYDEALEGHSINDIFMKDKKTDIHECIFNVAASEMENLYIIPANIDLSNIELELVSRYNRLKILRTALKKIENEFDYIFIDCPPQLGMLSLNGMCAADGVVIPVKADYISYRGLDALMNTIRDIQEPENELNKDLQIEGAIITMFEKMVNDQKDMQELIEEKIKVLGVVKKSADSYRNVVDGKAAVQAQKTSDVASSYLQIAEYI